MADLLRAEGVDCHRRGKDQRAREESGELSQLLSLQGAHAQAHFAHRDRPDGTGDLQPRPLLLRPAREVPRQPLRELYGRLARSRGGDVLGELDDQPLGTADVDEPIDVRVVLDLADRVEPVVPQAVDDRVEVLDLDADVPRSGGK